MLEFLGTLVKLQLLLAILSATSFGCASHFAPSIASVVGTYSSEADIDCWLSIVLAPDHTFEEWFVGGGVIVITEEDPVGAMPREKRAAGTWRLSGDTVVLSDETGGSRRLRFIIEGQQPLLEQRCRGHPFRFYKEPVQPIATQRGQPSVFDDSPASETPSSRGPRGSDLNPCRKDPDGV